MPEFKKKNVFEKELVSQKMGKISSISIIFLRWQTWQRRDFASYSHISALLLRLANCRAIAPKILS